MGIPRFYRWLSERYPLINEMITAEQIPEFDNLYLDMNGIVHNCSHNNTGGLCFKDEGEVFLEAFKYICRLFHIIRPKKLLYMAVDGCAPRAKMNQQRSRRFRAANDALEAREKAKEMGEDVSGDHFDSNCITPGTEFMAKLTEHLRFFLCKKLQEDPLWQGVTVVLSGPETPGEGEHKIMDYVRKMKAQPGYEPNQRHCLYGLDADLIMLALATHEPHFALLREEVVFGRRETKTAEQRMLISKDRFQLLHVSVVREYIDLEFTPQKKLKFTFDVERVIDDFILFCVLVGNDFLPCMPFAEIGEGGLDDFFNVYKEHLRAAESDPWLTENCGEINWERLAKFMKTYAEIEDGKLDAECDEGNFILGKKRMVGPRDEPDPANKSEDIPIEHPPTADDARLLWYDVKFGMDLNTHEGTQKQRGLFQSYLEGLHWVLCYYYRGPEDASWSWYYPFYHAPMAYDLANYDKLVRPEIQLDVGGPFRPFQQLMAVLPSNSKNFLPRCYQWLFESKESPILHFYPKKFEVDMDGVKTPWGGCTLIPWIDPQLLLKAMQEAVERGPAMTAAELNRNEFQIAHSYRFDRNAKISLSSPMSQRYPALRNCPVREEDFVHPMLPKGAHFPNILPKGCKLKDSGFPSLHLHPLTQTFEMGIKVFQFEARNKGLIVHLRPSSPIQPAEQEITELLRAPSAQIDYPCIHRGKVIAVHTLHTKYFPGGKAADNNPHEHVDRVWNLLQDWRRKGLSLHWDAAGDAGGRRGGCTDEELWQQPLVEVRIAESSYLDTDGRPQLRFKASSEFRLLHLVRPEKALGESRQRTWVERLPVGCSVVCVDPKSEVFGQAGRIEKTSEDADQVEAAFALELTKDEQQALQIQISQVVQSQHASLQWHQLASVARQAQLEVNVTRQILGSVMARCADNVREDVGMSIMVEAKGDSPALCLPCYSSKSPQGWWFSDLAVEALKHYKEKFPSLFEAIRTRRNFHQDLEQRNIFPTAPDFDWASRQLVKYVNSCAFKRLRLGPVQHMAMTSSSVQEVVAAVDSARSAASSRSCQVERIRGSHRLYKAEDSGSRPPAEVFPSGEDLMVGQRGVYIKPHGLVPCGAKGTVIGVYGSGATQELELVLDEDSFGATDLKGRAPAMKGLQIPATTFMPLHPRLDSSGGLVGRPAIESESEQQASRALIGLLKGSSSSQAEETSAAPKSVTDRIKNRLQAQLSGGAEKDASKQVQGGYAQSKSSDSAPSRASPSGSGKDADAAAAIFTALGRQVPASSGSSADELAEAGSKKATNGKAAPVRILTAPGRHASGPSGTGKGGSGKSGGPAGAGPPDWSKAFGDLLSLGAKKR